MKEEHIGLSWEDDFEDYLDSDIKSTMPSYAMLEVSVIPVSIKQAVGIMPDDAETLSMSSTLKKRGKKIKKHKRRKLRKRLRYKYIY